MGFNMKINMWAEMTTLLLSIITIFTKRLRFHLRISTFDLLRAEGLLLSRLRAISVLELPLVRQKHHVS